MGKLEHLFCTACGTINPISECLCISCFQPLNLWQDPETTLPNVNHHDEKNMKNNNQSEQQNNHNDILKRLMVCPNINCQAYIDIQKVNAEKSECPYCSTPISLPNQEVIEPKLFFIEFPWGREEVTQNMFFGRDSHTSPYAHLLHPKYDNISRSHAEIVYTPQKVMIRDLGSTNGTFINDQKLFPKETIALNHGDKIRLSKKFVMLFIEYSS